MLFLSESSGEGVDREVPVFDSEFTAAKEAERADGGEEDEPEDHHPSRATDAGDGAVVVSQGPSAGNALARGMPLAGGVRENPCNLWS
jgi:hypothetical protein